MNEDAHHRTLAQQNRTSVARISCCAVLFDLDGVLVDSTECVTRTWREWARSHGLDADKILAVAHGRRTIDTIRLIAPHLSAKAEAAALAEHEASETEGIDEVPGARSLLEAIPAQRWAVITAGTRPVATLRLSHVGLPIPEVLITAEELTHGKPHPEGYLAAAHRLRVPARDCIVVEDAPAGIEAAQAAGMTSIALTTTHDRMRLQGASWGLDSLRRLRATRVSTVLQLHLEKPLWSPV